jgi:hypothetical protein
MRLLWKVLVTREIFFAFKMCQEAAPFFIAYIYCIIFDRLSKQQLWNLRDLELDTILYVFWTILVQIIFYTRN